jgi:hypothetical protein
MNRAPLDQRFFREFGKAITTPLDIRSGRLTATPALYPPRLVAGVVASDGLEVYQRQYWLRLVGVIETEFPLTAQLMGADEFVAAAVAFLRRHPPCGVDIGEAADGFSRAVGRDVSSSGLLQAATAIDEAWRSVWRAPITMPWRPDPTDAGRLPHACLSRSPGRVVFRSRWNVVELRHAVAGATVPLPNAVRLAEEGAWLIRNGEEGIGSTRIEPLEASLIELLDRNPFSVALAKLEATVPPAQRGQLPERVRSSLTKWMGLGLWCGFQR